MAGSYFAPNYFPRAYFGGYFGNPPAVPNLVAADWTSVLIPGKADVFGVDPSITLVIAGEGEAERQE